MGGGSRRTSRRAVGPDCSSTESIRATPRIMGSARLCLSPVRPASAISSAFRSARSSLDHTHPVGHGTVGSHHVRGVGLRIQRPVQAPLDVVHGHRPRDAVSVLVAPGVLELLVHGPGLRIPVAGMGFSHVQRDECHAVPELRVQTLEGVAGVCGHGTGDRPHGEQQRTLPHEVTVGERLPVRSRQAELGKGLAGPWSRPEGHVLSDQDALEVVVPVLHRRSPPPVNVPRNQPRPRHVLNGFAELCHLAGSGWRSRSTGTLTMEGPMPSRGMNPIREVLERQRQEGDRCEPTSGPVPPSRTTS